MQADRVWVLVESQGWVTGTILGPAPIGKTKVKLDTDGQEVNVKKSEMELFISSNLKAVDDLITLDELNEPILLHCLKERYFKDQVYTRIGPMVVSVNPFKRLNIYSEAEIRKYADCRDTEKLPPHLFATAQNAFSNLVGMGNSQSVVISGESGAGKTEATKIILRFLMSVAVDKSGDLAKKILATNPILEAFGNAKTIRNNNSSRFGKLIRINFENGHIKGARINNYLLEATRVVFQAPEERNYHVFYQMLKGATAGERLKYNLLSGPGEYNYLKNGDIDFPGDDRDDWRVLKDSFEALQIPKSEQDEYFITLSAILHLGNLTFMGEDKVVINPSCLPMVDKIANMLGVPSHSLKTALEQRLFTTPRATSYYIPLTHAQAIENRDAMAKALYSKMFDWLIQRINLVLRGDENAKCLFIAILDIYGFELFDMNSMEQFCINYANEKLHDQFNQHMFKAEQQEYQKEGIPWKNITFADNKACIELIEKPGTGIIALLNEECSMPKGNEESLMQKFKQNHGTSKCFSINPRKHTLFEIAHYAETVPYTVDGFLHKNKNTLNADVTRTLMISKNKNISLAFGEIAKEQPDDGPSAGNQAMVAQTIGRAGSKVAALAGMVAESGTGRAPPGRNQTQNQSSKSTQCTIFKRELLSLMDLLESSNRHYVRCIKPNETKMPNDFHQAKVLKQLKSNGVMETVQVRKQGYLSKMTVETFFGRYKALGIRAASIDFCKAFLIQLHELDVNQWAVGKTKIFLRSNALIFLEEQRRKKYEKSVYVIQASILRWNAILLANLIRGEKQRELRRRLMTIASGRVQCLIRRYNAQLRLIAYRDQKLQAAQEERSRREQEAARLRAEEDRKKSEEERKRNEERARQQERFKQEERLKEQKKQEEERAAAASAPQPIVGSDLNNMRTKNIASAFEQPNRSKDALNLQRMKLGQSPKSEPSMAKDELQLAAERLCDLAGKGDIPALRMLLEKPYANQFINVPNSKGQTALYVASRLGQVDVVKELLKNQSLDINFRVEPHQGTALHAASFSQNGNIVLLLVYRGADQSLKNIYGLTPVQEAAGNAVYAFEKLKELASKGVSFGQSSTGTASTPSTPPTTPSSAALKNSPTTRFEPPKRNPELKPQPTHGFPKPNPFQKQPTEVQQPVRTPVLQKNPTGELPIEIDWDRVQGGNPEVRFDLDDLGSFEEEEITDEGPPQGVPIKIPEKLPSSSHLNNVSPRRPTDSSSPRSDGASSPTTLSPRKPAPALTNSGMNPVVVDPKKKNKVKAGVKPKDEKTGKKDFFGREKKKKDDSEFQYIDSEFERILGLCEDPFLDGVNPSLKDLEILAYNENILVPAVAKAFTGTLENSTTRAKTQFNNATPTSTNDKNGEGVDSNSKNGASSIGQRTPTRANLAASPTESPKSFGARPNVASNERQQWAKPDANRTAPLGATRVLSAQKTEVASSPPGTRPGLASSPTTGAFRIPNAGGQGQFPQPQTPIGQIGQGQVGQAVSPRTGNVTQVLSPRSQTQNFPTPGPKPGLAVSKTEVQPGGVNRFQAPNVGAGAAGSPRFGIPSRPVVSDPTPQTSNFNRNPALSSPTNPVSSRVGVLNKQFSDSSSPGIRVVTPRKNPLQREESDDGGNRFGKRVRPAINSSVFEQPQEPQLDFQVTTESLANLFNDPTPIPLPNMKRKPRDLEQDLGGQFDM